jgi:hypothetical protein
VTMTATDPAALATVMAGFLSDTGRSLDDLSAAEAIKLADTLRAVAALPVPSPLARRLSADLDAAAAPVERHAGTG